MTNGGVHHDERMRTADPRRPEVTPAHSRDRRSAIHIPTRGADQRTRNGGQSD